MAAVRSEFAPLKEAGSEAVGRESIHYRVQVCSLAVIIICFEKTCPINKDETALFKVIVCISKLA